MVTKKQLEALARGRAIRKANCKKKTTKTKYPKKCSRSKRKTGISFNDIFDGYQDEYNNHKLPDPEPEIEPKEPSPGLWDHITSAADTTWKALNSLTNAIGDGLYAVGDGVWNGTEYVFETGKKGGKKAADITKEYVPKAWDATKSGTSRAWDATKSGTSKAWNATKSGTSRAWDATKSGTSRAWDATKSGTSRAWEATKSRSSKVWEATKYGGGKAWEAAKYGGNKAWEWAKYGGNKAMDIGREYGPKAWEWAKYGGNKAKDLIKEYGPSAWEWAKYGGNKALSLMKAGGRAAMEAFKGPEGRLASMRVLMTEITNKLDHFKSAPTDTELAELVEKSNTLIDLLQAEADRNPDLPQNLIDEIEAIPKAINRIAKDLNYDTYFYD